MIVIPAALRAAVLASVVVASVTTAVAAHPRAQGSAPVPSRPHQPPSSTAGSPGPPLRPAARAGATPLPALVSGAAGSLVRGARGDDCVPAGLRLAVAPPGAPLPYRCPVPGPLAALFGAPATRYSAGHRGVDLLASVGDPVAAPAAGVVTFVGDVAGRPVVTLGHGSGWRTSLEPVLGSVDRGARVRAGDRIGAVAPAPGHCAPAVCVHLGVRRGESGDGYVDPLRLLHARVRVVLLPTG